MGMLETVAEEGQKWLRLSDIKHLVSLMRNWASRAPRTILLFHGPEYDRLFFRELIACLSREIGSRPFDMVCVVAQTRAELDEVLDAMEGDMGRVAGVIVLPTSLTSDCKSILEERLPKVGWPTLVLDKETELPLISGGATGRLFFDNKAGTEALHNALGRGGSRRAWWVGHAERLSDDEVVRAGCRDSWDAEMTVDAQTPRESALRAVLAKAICGPFPSDGLDIVCVNDDIAAGVDDALQCWSALMAERPDVRIFSFDCCSEMVRRCMWAETFFAGGVSQSPERLAWNAVQGKRRLTATVPKA